jgi:hypothetical protein
MAKAKRAMKTSGKRRAEHTKTVDKHPVTRLPFVKDKSKSGRHFWTVVPTGDFAVDCAIGEKYGLAYLEYLQTTNITSLMPQILPQMPRKLTGIEVGFFTMVDHAARAGSSAAFDLAAYWSRCHAEEHRKTKKAD